MALSLAELIVLCLFADYFLSRMHIPPLVGMLAVGALLGPQLLNLLDPSLIAVGSDLRMIALIVILLRAGFELSRESLHKVGLQALLLSFLPAVFETLVIVALAPGLLGLSRMESLLLGCVLAAVSPAVVVPMMVHFIQEKKGTEKGIPTLVLAGASLDDVTVIVAYSIVLGLYAGNDTNLARDLLSIPFSILFAIAFGFGIGLLLIRIFERINPRATKRALAILGISIFLVHLGTFLEARHIPFAARFAGFNGVALILIALAGRAVGTYLCTLGSGFNAKEKLFIVISYLPKATVQAAIGSGPLFLMMEKGMPLQPGKTILAVAVMSILITAPLGSLAISWAGEHLLSDDTRAHISSLSAVEESEGDYALMKD
jgi:NhaP-type Na+/H+ or K+/H+ antiporter